MKILVTGALGFMGSHLVDALVKQHTVYGIDNLSGGFLENSSWQGKEYRSEEEEKGGEALVGSGVQRCRILRCRDGGGWHPLHRSGSYP